MPGSEPLQQTSSIVTALTPVRGPEPAVSGPVPAEPIVLLLRLFLGMLCNAITGAAPGSRLPVRIEAFGLRPSEHQTRLRSEEIFRACAIGLDAGWRGARCGHAWAATVAPLLRPFYWEGATMAMEGRRVLSFHRGQRSISRDEAIEHPFAFLRVVGVGLAIGVLPTNKLSRLERAARSSGNLGALVYDGYGFATGLLGGRVEVALEKLDRLSGFPHRSALNGLGRCLWFRHLDRSAASVEVARRSEHVLDLLGGMGLAAAFTFPDDLGRAYRVAGTLRGAERRAFVKGIRLALLIREYCDRGLLEALLDANTDEIQNRARRDLEVARNADAATRQSLERIQRLHEACAAD